MGRGLVAGRLGWARRVSAGASDSDIASREMAGLVDVEREA